MNRFQALHFRPKTTLDTSLEPSLSRLRSPCHARVSRPRNNNVSINCASRSESEGDGAKGHVPSCASTLRRASRSALSAYPSECGDWGPVVELQQDESSRLARQTSDKSCHWTASTTSWARERPRWVRGAPFWTTPSKVETSLHLFRSQTI